MDILLQDDDKIDLLFQDNYYAKSKKSNIYKYTIDFNKFLAIKADNEYVILNKTILLTSHKINFYVEKNKNAALIMTNK